MNTETRSQIRGWRSCCALLARLLHAQFILDQPVKNLVSEMIGWLRVWMQCVMSSNFISALASCLIYSQP